MTSANQCSHTPLNDQERGLVLEWGRRDLGLSPATVHARAADHLASVNAALDLLSRAEVDQLLVRVRRTPPVRKDPRSPALREPVWIAADRRHEWEAVSLTSDVARTVLAVQVAEMATGSRSVRTKDITDVMRHVPELQPDAGSLTNTLLGQAVAAQRVVTGTGDAPAQRRRWQSVGTVPTGHAFSRWVELMRPHLMTRVVGSDGPRGLAELMQEVVELTVKHFITPARWPFGRPVSVQDIKRAAASDERIVALVDGLTAGQPLARCLADATRVRAGCPRTRPGIVVLEAVQGRGALYDVQSLAGYAERQVYPTFRGLIEDTCARRLDAWRNEIRQASWLRTEDAPSVAIATLAAVRLVHARHALSSLGERCRRLLGEATGLGTQARDQIRENLGELQALLETVQGTEEAQTEATTFLATIGAPSLAEVLAAEDAGLVADELAELVREPALDKMSPALWAAQLKTLEFRVNPAFRHRAAKTARARCERLYDRPTAIVHVAQRRNARAAAALERALRLVGRGPRSSAMYAAVFGAAAPEERADALLAYALVDGNGAGRVARHVACDARELGATRATAVTVLQMEGLLDAKTIEQVELDPDPYVQVSLDDALLAQAEGQRLP